MKDEKALWAATLTVGVLTWIGGYLLAADGHPGSVASFLAAAAFVLVLSRG